MAHRARRAGRSPDRSPTGWRRTGSRWPAAWRRRLGGSVVYGVRRADGSFARRSSPQELAWLTELGAQLDRLGEDWDPLLSDSDALTTLVVEVTAALVEAGLPLHDGSAADGTAVPDRRGVPDAGPRPPAGSWSAGASTTG